MRTKYLYRFSLIPMDIAPVPAICAVCTGRANGYPRACLTQLDSDLTAKIWFNAGRTRMTAKYRPQGLGSLSVKGKVCFYMIGI